MRPGIKTLVLIVALVALFTACESGQPVANAEPMRYTFLDSLANGQVLFNIPDSLDKKLIVATFFEQAENANSVIVYADNFKEGGIL